MNKLVRKTSFIIVTLFILICLVGIIYSLYFGKVNPNDSKNKYGLDTTIKPYTTYPYKIHLKSKRNKDSYWYNLAVPGYDDVYALYVANTGYIFAGTRYSIERSKDNGITWQEVLKNCPPIESIKGYEKGAIIAKAGNGHCYLVFSTDEGDTWKKVFKDGNSEASNAFLSESGSIMFKDLKGVWYHSENYGKNWTKFRYRITE